MLAVVICWIGPAAALPGASTPEVIDFANYMSVTQDHIYYSTDGHIELECSELVGEVYGRVANGQGAGSEEQLVTDCDGAPYPREAMVSDGETTYFISYVKNFNLHALFSRPADGSGTAAQLTLDVHVAPRALAHDDDYVYYAVIETTAYIFRREKAGTAVEVVTNLNDVAGGFINDLALDDSHVYWTEGAEGDLGRVRRVEKSGGPPELVAENLALPWELTTYNDSVYWTELEGKRIARHLKSGAGLTDMVHQANQPVTALTLHDDILYFGMGSAGTMNGSLWRASSAGFDPVLMAFGFPAPREIAWVEGWIYWVDGRLKRLPPDAEVEGVDYAIEWMEVTQGVQDGDNNIPLVAVKPTYVRVYAREIDGVSPDLVRARLHGFRNGVPLPGSPLWPIRNSNLDLDANRPLREEGDRTFVFLLPPSWTTIDGLQLQAEVNPNDQVFENNYANNLYPPAPEAFNIHARIMCLITYPVAAETETGDTVIFDNSAATFDPRMNRAKAMLPTIMMVYKESAEVWLEGEDGALLPHNITTSGGWSALLNAVQDLGELSDPPGGCTDDAVRYAGLIDNGADWKSFGGMAGGKRWAARWWDSDSDVDYNQPGGGFLWAHEMGHTLGSPHVDCGGAGGPAYYPYPPCQNDDSDGEEDSWGYDPLTGAVLNPVGHKDLMAYGSTRWVSDFTWQCIFDYVGDVGGSPFNTGVEGCDWPLEGPPLQARDGHETVDGLVLAIQGAIAQAGDVTISSMAVYPDAGLLTEAQLALADEAPTAGAYEVVLMDEQGQKIAAKHFDVEEFEHYDLAGEMQQRFSVVLRHDGKASRLMIREAGGATIAEREGSANEPALELKSATLNAQGQLVMDFKVEDPDGDVVKVMGQYVDVDGRIKAIFGWRQWGEAQFTCDPCSWPARTLPGGGSGMVRVFASDGLRTTMAELPLRMPGHTPEANLDPVRHGPLDGQGRATYLVWPNVWDAEDGPLGPESIAWYVNGRRVNCDCHALPVSAETLEAGRNGGETVTVALVATDSDNQTTRVEIEVDLTPDPEPPPPVYQLMMPVIVRD